MVRSEDECGLRVFVEFGEELLNLARNSVDDLYVSHVFLSGGISAAH